MHTCLLLGLREDTVRLQYVVGGRVPQTQMHRPASRDKPVVVRVKGYPGRGESVTLGCLLHLRVKPGGSPSREQPGGGRRGWQSRFRKENVVQILPIVCLKQKWGKKNNVICDINCLKVIL